MSFRDEAKARREETERLESTNRRLQDELEKMRQRLLATERSVTRTESKGGSSTADASAPRIRELEQALADAKEQGDKRVSETSQFQQMRAMMQSQNNKIRDLRRRLDRYEPDTVKEEDA